MKRESKNLEEIYRERYTDEMFADNPVLMIEAIGFLNALLMFQPSEKWIASERITLITAIKYLFRKEGEL